MRIVQMSDFHVGSTFVPDLMDAAIEEINAFGPDTTLRYPGEGREPLAGGSRRPVANFFFYPPHERYVRHDRLPF